MEEKSTIVLGKTRKLRVYANTFKVENRTCVSYKTIVKFKHKDEAGVVVLDEAGKPKYFEHEVDLKFLQDANREDGLIVQKLIGFNNGYLLTNSIDKPEFFEHYWSEKKQKEIYPSVWVRNIVGFEKATLEAWVNPYKQNYKRESEVEDDEFESFDNLPNQELPF